MVLPPIETIPVMLLRFTPDADRETILDIIESLQQGGIIIVESEGLDENADEDKKAEIPVVLGLTTTQKLLEHEAELMRLRKPCRTNLSHVPVLPELFTRGNRADFIQHDLKHPEDYDAFGLFSSADRTLLLEAMINAIPAPIYLQKANLELCAYGNGGSLLQSLSFHDSDDVSTESAIMALKTQELIDAFCPVHIGRIKRRIAIETYKWWTPLPLDSMRDYYGEQTAYYFAWMDFMSRWFVLPGIVGLVVFLLRVLVNKQDVDTCEFTPFVGLLTFLWAVLCNKFWERRENQLAFDWGTFSFAGGPQESLLKLGRRPGFKGHMSINPVTGKKELYFSPAKRRLRYLVTFLVTLILLSFASTFMVISMNAQGYISSNDFPKDREHPLLYPFIARLAEPGGIFDAESPVKSIIPIIIRAAVVFAMNSVYSRIAERLTEFENHQTIVDHQNSLILKRILFEAFDAFIILFYLACFEKNVSLLRMELVGAFNVDTLRRVFTECALPYMMKNYSKREKVGRKKKDDDAKNNAPSGVLSEEADLEIYQQFDDYIEMLIQFGYVTLFASAYTLAPALAAIATFIEMRSDMWKLNHLHQRPNVMKTRGLGVWSSALKLIGWLSAFSNLLIFAFTSSQMRAWFPDWYSDSGDGKSVMKDSSAADVMFTLWMIEHAFLLIGFFVRVMIPSIPRNVRIELLRHSFFLEMEASRGRFATMKRYSREIARKSTNRQNSTSSQSANKERKIRESKPPGRMYSL